MKKEMKELQTIVGRIYRKVKKQEVKPLTVDEACKYLGLKKSYLYKLTSENKIAYYKPDGKRIFFKKRDLDKYVFRNKVNAVDDLLAQVTIRKKK